MFFPNANDFYSHLRLVHSKDEEFGVTCGINGCTGYYRKCSSFLSHVYRHHREVVISAPSTRAPLVASSSSSIRYEETIASSSMFQAHDSLSILESCSASESLHVHYFSLSLSLDASQWRLFEESVSRL